MEISQGRKDTMSRRAKAERSASAAVSTGQRPGSRTWKRIWKYRYIYLFLLPAVIWFIAFAYTPMVGLLLAFKDFKYNMGILGSPWVGLKYFKNFLSDPMFFRVIRNTLKISLLKMAFGFPAPIILALMINEVKNGKFKKTAQTVSYLPYFVSWVVVITMLSKFLSPTNGLINDIRVQRGLEPVYYQGKPNLFYPLVVLTDIWKNIGWNSIIYLSALTGIDPGLYEAAEIEGAGRWAKTWHITLPGIRPTIGILFIMNLGGILNAGYEQILLMQTPPVMDVAEVLDTYVLQRGLKMNQFGYATAIGLFSSAISLILVVVTNYISRKTTEVSLW